MRVERTCLHEIKDWLLTKHYAHRLPNVVHAYAAYEDGVMKGVITFGMPASYTLCKGVCGEEYKDQVIELNRLVVDENKNFTTSSFVSTALKRLQQMLTTGGSVRAGCVIVSYADTGMGHIGKIYQATNFIYTGATKERTDPVSGDGHHRHKECDPNAERQVRTSKHRYIYFVGTRQFKRAARMALKYKVLPYPEGETKRYDASYKPESQTIFNL